MPDLYVIYENPLDYPGQYVLRRWVARGAEYRPEPDPLEVHPLLSRVRSGLPQGVVSLGRNRYDDLAIREVWV